MEDPITLGRLPVDAELPSVHAGDDVAVRGRDLGEVCGCKEGCDEVWEEWEE